MVQQFEQTPQKAGQSRVSAENRYPVYDLASAIELADAIRNKGGGQADLPHLASYLKYSSTNNGAFLNRISASRLFGLTEKSGKVLVPTPLATRIVAPERPGVDDRRARVEAFKSVPLYQRLLARYSDSKLPPEMGLRNILETAYGVPRTRTQIAYRVFMDSADQAGFFEARGGTRTHLVEPPTGHTGAPPEDHEGAGEEAFNPGDGRIEQEMPTLDGSDPIRQLRQMLVQKVKDVPATDLDTIREYIKEIKELAALEEDE